MVQSTSFRRPWTTAFFELVLFRLVSHRWILRLIRKIRTDNLIIEAISWCADQTLLSQNSNLFLMFPEDLGGPLS